MVKLSTYQCKRRRHGFDPWVVKIPWRRKWQPIPGFLPEKSHGQRSMVGYNPWGCKDLTNIHTHVGVRLELGNFPVRRLLICVRLLSRKGGCEVLVSNIQSSR